MMMLRLPVYSSCNRSCASSENIKAAHSSDGEERRAQSAAITNSKVLCKAHLISSMAVKHHCGGLHELEVTIATPN